MARCSMWKAGLGGQPSLVIYSMPDINPSFPGKTSKPIRLVEGTRYMDLRAYHWLRFLLVRRSAGSKKKRQDTKTDWEIERHPDHTLRAGLKRLRTENWGLGRERPREARGTK